MNKFFRLTVIVTALPVFLLLVGQAHAQPTVTGAVVSADGKPVEGAEVIPAAPGKPAWPNLSPEDRKKDESGNAMKSAVTDKDGKFTLELPENAGLLSVTHPKLGYAVAKPEALGESADPIKLERWCRVEGTVKLGTKPAAAGTKVSLGVFFARPDASGVHYGYDTTTDADGRYALDRVPAGVNLVKVKASPTGSPLDQYVGADPDKPARLDIGGRGRQVVGKIAIDNWDVKELSNPDAKAKKLISYCHFRRDVPWPKPPYFDSGAQTPQEHEEILVNYRRTPEALEQWKDQHRYNVEFQPDGTYRFDDVPPGKYFLTLTILGREDDGRSTMVAKQRVEVTVPETPAVPTDEALDIGEQRIEAAAPGTEGL